MKEFSKIMVTAFGVVWILAAVFGSWYSVKFETGFSDWLLFVGGPITAGVAGYYCKAGFENVKKIKNSINERDL